MTPLVAIGDLASEIRSGFACGEQDDNGVVQFRMNNVGRDGAIDWAKLRRVPRSAVKRGLTLSPGDILFNATNSPELVGKTALFAGFDEDVTFSNHFVRLRPKPGLAHPGYVARWLQAQFERGTFSGMCRQWVNQATVTKDQLANLQLPLPSLDEQRRIAAILDKADALRRKRKRTLDLLDGLTDSIFFDMFGDPVRNPFQLQTAKIGEVCEVITGNTPPRSNAALYGTAVEWIKSDNILPPERILSMAAEFLSLEGRAVARLAPPASTLVTCIAGSPNSIGNCAMADREVAFNQQINALVTQDLNPVFLYSQLRVGKKLVQAASTGGMKGMVSKSRLQQVTLLNPSRSLQDSFASRAKRALDIADQQRATVRGDTLFASLHHRAFSGSL